MRQSPSFLVMQTRGLGYADGRIYFVTLDGQAFALPPARNRDEQP